MKTLETNPNESPYLNSLMLPTWYPISTLHILPSPVLFYCPKHAIAVVPCLHTFQQGFSFINFLVYSVCLFSLILSFCVLFRVFSQNFKLLFILILVFLTYIFNSQKIKILLKEKQETANLGRWQSFLLLTFSGAILGPLHIIPTLLLSDCSFQTPSPLHYALILSN